jgi:hypothetical protein
MAGVWAVRAAGHIPDDMFITFRYAWNLAHGEGFVFNPGERVFGLTNPGHALVLALLHAVTRIPIHTLAVVAFAAGLWAAVVLVWREGLRRSAGVETAIGATLVLSASYLWVAAGSEPAVVLGLLAGSTCPLWYRSQRPGHVGNWTLGGRGGSPPTRVRVNATAAGDRGSCSASAIRCVRAWVKHLVNSPSTC